MGATSALSAPCRQPLHAEQPEQAEPQQEDAANACEGQPTCPRQGPPDYDSHNPNLSPRQRLMQPRQGRRMPQFGPLNP